MSRTKEDLPPDWQDDDEILFQFGSRTKAVSRAAIARRMWDEFEERHGLPEREDENVEPE